MKQRWMIGVTVLVVAALTGVVGAQAPKSEVFDFSEEVKKGEQRAGFTLKQMVKTPTYTVGALAVKDEIKMHRHKDGNHVLYIVSGRGTAILDGGPVTLKPGTVVHIPKGSTHNVKAEGGELTILDLAHPPFDPTQMEWVK